MTNANDEPVKGLMTTEVAVQKIVQKKALCCLSRRTNKVF